jgi:hypothetical protein
MSFNALTDERLKFFPLILLKVLQSFQTNEHTVFTSVLQTDSFDSF